MRYHPLVIFYKFIAGVAAKAGHRHLKEKDVGVRNLFSKHPFVRML